MLTILSFSCCFLSVVVCLLTIPANPLPLATSNLRAAVHLSAEQDRQRTMDLLHITSLRRGADGDPKPQYAANYDDSKVVPGKEGIGTTIFPPIETALADGDIAFRQRSGGHTPCPNWPTFLTFAGRYMNGQPQVVNSAATTAHRDAVALTFDDLPAHGPLPVGLTRVDIANSIIKALRTAHAPPTFGFVNAKRLDEDPSSAQVLQLWRDAGFPLGNHTFSHMDLDANSAATFEQDLLGDEPVLQKFMADEDWRWLRFPFLREGDTVEKHRAIATFLKQHGYRVAEVTLSFGDYAYNEPYARCLAKNDQRGIEQLKRSYLDGAAASLDEGRNLSNLAYGRNIKHVMLLHIGGFETVMLPHLLNLLEQRGFKLITLQEAEADPAYATDPDLSSNWDGTFLQQMIRARHISVTPSEDRLAKIETLCR